MFNSLEKFKKNIALINNNEDEYSYEHLLKLINLINAKIKKRSLILLITSNSAESIIGYVSFIKFNNVTILLDNNFTIEYANKIIKKYQPNYIFSPKNYLQKAGTILACNFLKEYSLIKTNYKTHNKINSKNFLLLSTSGTTQSPKFVRLSKKNLHSNTKNIINYLGIKSSHTTITTMPMGYSYGLSIINTHLESGSKIIVNNKTIFDREFWKKIIKYKVTSLGGVPQFYEQLKKIKFENFDLSSLKYLTQAGGKLEIFFLKYFGNICKKNKLKFFVMYGQTEASPRMSYLDWKKLFSKMESIGKPLKGSKFKIIDKRKKYINKPFINGELVYYGENVSLGYAHSLKDLNKGNINKGKLYTGDLAYKDKQGYFYIVGRKNRFSKIFGKRIDLDDIEKKLNKDNFKIKCIPDNKFLKIEIINDYNLDEIKKVINNLYGINQNFILIQKVKKFTHQNYFKDIKKV